MERPVNSAGSMFVTESVQSWAYNEDATAKYLDLTKQAAIGTLADAGNRLRQYEYILRVAVFESCLKEVHRTILKAVPSLLKIASSHPAPCLRNAHARS
jgi:hypothetical protein